MLKTCFVDSVEHGLEVDMCGNIIEIEVLFYESVSIRIGDEDNFRESAFGEDHFFVPDFFYPVHQISRAVSGFVHFATAKAAGNRLIFIVLHLNKLIFRNIKSG